MKLEQLLTDLSHIDLCKLWKKDISQTKSLQAKKALFLYYLDEVCRLCYWSPNVRKNKMTGRTELTQLEVDVITSSFPQIEIPLPLTEEDKQCVI